MLKHRQGMRLAGRKPHGSVAHARYTPPARDLSPKPPVCTVGGGYHSTLITGAEVRPHVKWHSLLPIFGPDTQRTFLLAHLAFHPQLPRRHDDYSSITREED